MNRSEFLRKGLLALVATGIGLNGTKSVEVEKFTWVKKVKKIAQFKITREALKDSRYFAWLLDEHRVYGKILTYEIGIMDDDFTKDLLTVRIEYADRRI